MEQQREFLFGEVLASGENLTLDFREAKIQPIGFYCLYFRFSRRAKS